MSTSHTPGPWQVVDNYDNYEEYSPETPQIYIWDGDEQAHKPICDMGEMGDMNYAQEIANARLIAAAPDLLEALKGLLAICEPGEDFQKEMNAAAEAIEKATKP